MPSPATAQTWILTGSPENYAVTRERGFDLIGLKERHRRSAEAMTTGDRIVLYMTRAMVFAASVRVTGDLFEDRTKVWPGKPAKPDAYPWRFDTEPEIVLEEEAWLPAENLVDELEHIRKWPPEHWKLAFQGQIRPVSERDAGVLLERMAAAASVTA